MILNEEGRERERRTGDFRRGFTRELLLESVARRLPFQAQFIILVLPEPQFHLLLEEKIGIISPPLQVPLGGEGAIIWAYLKTTNLTNPFYMLSSLFFSCLSLHYSHVFDKYLLSIYYIADTPLLLGTEQRTREADILALPESTSNQ